MKSVPTPKRKNGEAITNASPSESTRVESQENVIEQAEEMGTNEMEDPGGDEEDESPKPA